MLPIRLKNARLRANLTQEKLGILSGIEEATARFRVSQYESGVHRPNFEMICAFAKVLLDQIVWSNLACCRRQ